MSNLGPASNPAGKPRDCVVTVGNFDGVHRGHQALVHAARAMADARNARVLALAFDPNPQEVLTGAAPARLTTFDQRRELLLRAGADEVVQLVPTREFLAQSPETFFHSLRSEHGLVGIVEGPDFRFGKGRKGDIPLLRALCADAGAALEVVPPLDAPLTDHLLMPARSSSIRWLLEQGRVSDAACLLGRAYAMPGVVVRGDRRGRTIGFPTINLSSPVVPPADGVYAGWALLPNGRVLAAAISVGSKPTFDGNERAVEAYLFEPGTWLQARPDAPPWTPIPGLPEYGWGCTLEFHAFIRDQVRFASLGALLEQLARDCRRVDDLLSRPRAFPPGSSAPSSPPVGALP